THPFHPLFGREIDFVNRIQRWDEDWVVYRDPDEYLLWLPARWTSVEAEDPFIIVSAGRSHFRAADLIDLAALIAALRRVNPNIAIYMATLPASKISDLTKYEIDIPDQTLVIGGNFGLVRDSPGPRQEAASGALRVRLPRGGSISGINSHCQDQSHPCDRPS